jgi:hypothetical protein
MEQPPQFLASVVRFAHVPLQFVAGGVHAAAHAPAAQTCPGAHALPQEPHRVGVVTSASQPFDAMPSQFAHPA